ncbi:MAG TPA: imidazolonepropionase [Polyangiaceae bacterium]|nr:imidazolonepropionase [Polyangiaceae bacterium]
MNVLIRGALLIPGDGGAPRPDTDVRVEAARIAEIGSGLAVLPSDRLVVEARGRVLMPAFVDAHTHALWAGDRLDEFAQRLAGKSYVEILKAGGGILSTVRAVRAASEAELAEGLAERLERMLREGSATVEVKSGYGLSTEHELKMLRAIAIAAQRFSGTVVPTALLGHALDPEQPNFVERVISETLPAVHEEFPGIFVDAFCEEGAWSLADCARLLRRAAELGHPCRLHADQFQRLGALELSVELGLVSVDHLEASTPSDLERLARSSTFGVVLPVSGLHLDGRYANVRPFLDAGGRLVLASNCNPGSAPSSSMPLVIALAVRHCGVLLDEALKATTYNPAQLLSLTDRGCIAPGQRADLMLLRHRDVRQLGYELGGNPVEWVMVAGAVV